MRIEQYFLMTYYSLWEVIINGDSPIPTIVVDGVVQQVSHKSADQKLARRNELKAREKCFGGNTKTKKVQKTLLKQQFENFTGSSSENLDQIHDRLQKLTHTLIWRNKADLEEHSLDDLFNSLKIYEAKVKHPSSPVNPTQNLAFVSSSNTDSTTDSVSAATSVSAVCAKLHVSSHPNTDSLSNAVIFSFFSSQSTSPQLDNEDLKQIDVDDLEEMGLRWQMAMLTIKARRDIFLGSVGLLRTQEGCYDWSYQAEEEPTNFVLLAITSSSSSSDNEEPPCSKACLEFVEARLVVCKQNESILEENIKLLNVEVQARDTALVTLRQKLNQAEHKRDDLKLKLDKFQSSSKNLTELLASQTNDKPGLGYFSLESDCESLSPSSPSDRLQPSGGYHVVPPPITGTFMLPKLDLVFHIAPIAVETDHSTFTVWLNESENNDPRSVPSFVQSSEQVKTPRQSVQPVKAPILDTTLKPISLKSNSGSKRRNRKTCFVCRSVDHLIKDCNYHAKKKAQPTPRNYGNPQYALKDKGVINSGCSLHMTGNMSYLSDFEELNGGYVAFGGNPKGGKISGKGKIKTSKLDFEVYFVKELKFNLFSVSQMCDKKNKVLFTNTECLVLSLDFKLPDESQVLLRIPSENNMYNVNLKNIVPSRDLTCLSAKATIDESNLWHRRLGHINFKTINKLVKGNLVRGLPTKVFENNNTCVACKKGKQHRASCKTKPVSFIDQPLFRLHMDLFGPTFVKSLNKKSYCLVITDDYSRFTWVFFLVTKDETSPILKSFITGLENQLSLNMKEFSVPMTPQQNGIAERKNRTLFEAARSKFKEKVDEGFLVGYSVNSKVFRVFNSRTRIVQETLHVNFLENKPNIAVSGPTWLFDIDSLTRTMNYQPVTARNQSNRSAGFQDEFDAEKAGEEVNEQYVLFSTWSSGSKNPQNNDEDAAFDEKKHDAKKPESEVNVSPSSSTQSGKQDDMTKKKAKGKSPIETFIGNRDLNVEFEDHSDNSSNDVNAAGSIVPTAGQNHSNITNPFSAAGSSNTTASPTHGKSSFKDASQLPENPDMLEMEDITYSDHKNVGAEADFNNLETSITEELFQFKMQKVWILVDLLHGKRAIGTKWVYRNKKDESGIIVRNKARLVAQGHTQEERINYEEVFAPVLRIEDIRLFLAYASFMGFMVYQMDVKQKKDGIFISQDKYVAEILKKFGLTEGKSASTPIDIEKPLLRILMVRMSMYISTVKRIFRYLKGKPHLGLWYPKDSSFDLVAYSDSDYAGASLNRKSTIGGCQFLGCRLISWQCKKQTVVATSSTEAEYVAAASCCTQVLWI
nr:putative ribonuclease H-like domain-containing protein [Tanacetum cinerariifolium]